MDSALLQAVARFGENPAPHKKERRDEDVKRVKHGFSLFGSRRSLHVRATESAPRAVARFWPTTIFGRRPAPEIPPERLGSSTPGGCDKGRSEWSYPHSNRGPREARVQHAARDRDTPADALRETGKEPPAAPAISTLHPTRARASPAASSAAVVPGTVVKIIATSSLGSSALVEEYGPLRICPDSRAKSIQRLICLHVRA